MKPLTKEVYDKIASRARGIRFTLKHVSTGTMANSFVLRSKSRKGLRNAPTFTPGEQQVLLLAIKNAGMWHWDKKEFPKESWRCFQDGELIWFTPRENK